MESELHPNNVNKKVGFFLSTSWKPVIHVLTEQKQVLAKDMECASSHPSSAVGPYKDLQ
jgi:hypothetical protein